MRVKNGASACVHLLNVLYCPKLHSCQRKHLYYEVQLLGILCVLAHPLQRHHAIVVMKDTNIGTGIIQTNVGINTYLFRGMLKLTDCL